MSLKRTMVLLPVMVALVACTSPAASPTAAPPTAAPATATAAPATEAPTEEPTAAPTEAPATPTAVADMCASIDSLLQTPGRLTLSTDIPAFPPWWGGSAAEQYDNEPEGGSPWSESEFSAEPYSMEGFEGATAYAVAAAMGFGPEQVVWLANPVFEQAFAPGDKSFDFHMAQISATEDRAQAVTFSEPYFDSNQSLLALTANPITSATSIADLKGYRLGAAQNTTSFRLIEEVIQPDVEPFIFTSNGDVKAALEGNTVDGVIVDLSTAFYMRNAELDDFDTDEPEGTIVGQFGPPAEPDHVAFVLELDNALVGCVNQALAEIKADGTHEAILDEWINTGQDVPFLE